MKRNPVRVKLSIFVVVTLFLLSCTETWARPPRAKEACGTCKKIDYETNALTLSREKGGEPLSVVLKRDTKFMHNWKFTNSASWPEGLRACVYYRSPFFGKPFVTKVVWTDGSSDKQLR